MTKKSLLLCISLVLTLALGLGGTLAFLTDTDGKVNTFTMGDVDIALEESYEDGTVLMPGVEVDKTAGIKNIGANDAYVFMTIAKPGSPSDPAVDLALDETGWTPYDVQAITIDGEEYALEIYLYDEILAAGESTNNLLTGIELNEKIDYDPINDSYVMVAGGVETPINVDLKDGKVYVNAFAIQTEGFTSVQEAYNAYMGQWTADNLFTEEQILLPKVPVAPQPEPLPEPDAIANSQEELATAFADADNKVIHLSTAGTYKVPNVINRELTITGTADTVIDMSAIVNGSGSTVTFQGVTIDYANNSSYIGVQHAAEVIYKDCIINGQMYSYAPVATFDRCEFNNSGNNYNLWTYASEDLTFNDCTFNSSGKAILVYNEATNSSFVADLTMNRCTFNDDGTNSGKGAVETGSNGGNTPTSNKYNLTFVDTTVNDFDKNNTDYVEFGNKNSLDHDHLNVIINGTDVY